MTAMNLIQATKIAERVKSELAPHCERIEIAGSIRRRKPEVGDIEIVCIPRTCEIGLFLGSEIEIDPGFCHRVEHWPAIKGKPTGKYTQRQLPDGIVLDLFMATRDNWGLIYAIRTGSADYSHHVLASAWVRAGYHSMDGMLVKDNHKIPVREERDLFALIGLPWADPWERNL
jgi:DNA polymerase/3'-5' exonuclease PolX